MNLISNLSNGAVILLVLVPFFLASVTYRKNRRDALHQIPIVRAIDNMLYAILCLVVAIGVLAVLLWR